MNERIVRRDWETGLAQVIGLDEAVSEISESPSALFSEIAPMLRSGECLRMPDGRIYCALASMDTESALPLPPSAAN